MEYVSLINNLLTLFLGEDVTKNLVMEKKENTEIIYIYYTIIQYEYGE